MSLHWHRQDLRTSDTTALALASEAGPVVPLFVLDDDVLEHAGPPRVRFLLDALESLRGQYRDRGSDLLVERGDPREVLPAVADRHGLERVTANADYTGLARRRDERVEDRLADAGIALETAHDALLFEPGSITTNAGDVYSVFSYFRDKWLARAAPDPVGAVTADDLADVEGDPLPTLEDLGVASTGADLPAAGTGPARERLGRFCDGPIYDYEEDRDYPARDGTSGLSQDLAFGTIGIREVYEATRPAMHGAGEEDDRSSVTEFREQLAWRDFYAHALWDAPEIVRENVADFQQPIEWRDDPAELSAWKRGETGYPIVDAGMRQLREEAFMHNRLRMIVASFLTKDLLTDWRAGYRWFRERLVDHDTANDVGGWQWAASTGNDAQPYFRVFNPMTQGERYDPEATYIGRYVPELDGLAPEHVHGWHELSPGRRDQLAPEYPSPIVDHAERREAAIAMYERARGG